MSFQTPLDQASKILPKAKFRTKINNNNNNKIIMTKNNNAILELFN